MSNKKIAIIIATLVVVIGGYVLFSGGEEGSSSTVNGSTASKASTSSSVQPTTGSASGTTTNAATKTSGDQTVTIRNHKLPSGIVTVSEGDTVTFENTDSFSGLPYDAHTITSGKIDTSGGGVAGVVPNSGSGTPDGVFEEPLGLNETYSYTFDEAGKYAFYISEHPKVSGQGSVVVEVASAASEVISMKSTSFAYSPETITAKVNEPLTIDIDSVGKHTFTIDELGVDVLTPAGVVTTVAFTPTKKGTYEFYCAIPGHRAAGQVGTLIVE